MGGKNKKASRKKPFAGVRLPLPPRAGHTHQPATLYRRRARTQKHSGEHA